MPTSTLATLPNHFEEPGDAGTGSYISPAVFCCGVWGYEYVSEVV